MKKSITHFLVAGVLVWNLGACSSTATETTTGSTAETISTNDPKSATRAGETGVALQNNPEAAAAATTIDTTSFAIMAASTGMFETLSSEMALQRGQNAEVKNLAQSMLAEHNKSTSELKSLAARKNITLPNGPIPMHQQVLLELTNTTDGKKFDERYLDAQVTAHQQAVAIYEKAAKKEKDPDLQAFAAKTLPTMRMHLDMAKKTKDLLE